jgi:radical SAM superfamily enzyme YgiQ (UPF0313 family)
LKKILFLIKNIRDQRYGILCLAAYLKERGHVLDYVHVNNEECVSNVLKKIEGFQPDYLAITAMSGEIKFLLSLVKEIKAVHPNLYTVLGGPHATFSPEIIEHPLIDAICRAEGEEAFAEFLEKHPSGDYHSVRNFSFKRNGNVVHNPLRPSCDINALPTPDYDFIPRQVSEKIIVFVSRGCVFNCAYCFNKEYKEMYKNHGHGQPYRYMSVERAIKEVKTLKEKYCGEFKYFYFQDDVFPTKMEWLAEFSERYPEEIGIPFHVGLNPALIKESAITLLKKAGCFSMNLAIESGSERIRKIMNRQQMGNGELIRACRIVRKCGIYIDTQNIIMSPTETLDEAKQTLELNIACKVNNGVVGKYQPYPGTRMAKFAIKQGLVDEDDIMARLPENYHWESILKFDKKEAVQMDNLLHLFSFIIKYPFLKRLVYAILPFKWDWLFHRIDNQFWMTHTHRGMESIYRRNLLEDICTHILFAKRLFFPKGKQTFIY